MSDYIAALNIRARLNQPVVATIFMVSTSHPDLSGGRLTQN